MVIREGGALTERSGKCIENMNIDSGSRDLLRPLSECFHLGCDERQCPAA